ncbi:MAG: Type 1 glutamine amidotransferase-like domain-containing protein [Clostridiaceae bacterium]
MQFSGASAGSIVLGTTIELVHEFEMNMNDNIGLTDFTGADITEINICPHYSRFINRYNNFEERICKVENKYNISVNRINGGEAIIVDNNSIIKI